MIGFLIKGLFWRHSTISIKLKDEKKTQAIKWKKNNFFPLYSINWLKTALAEQWEVHFNRVKTRKKNNGDAHLKRIISKLEKLSKASVFYSDALMIGLSRIKLFIK